MQYCLVKCLNINPNKSNEHFEGQITQVENIIVQVPGNDQLNGHRLLPNISKQRKYYQLKSNIQKYEKYNSQSLGKKILDYVVSCFSLWLDIRH